MEDYNRIERVNIVKILILPKFVYRLSTIQFKIPTGNLWGLEKWILKSTCKYSVKIDKVILMKESKVERLALPDVIIYYHAIGIKTVWQE